MRRYPIRPNARSPADSGCSLGDPCRSGGIQINRVSEGAAILAPRIQRLRSELDPGSQENFDLVEAHALYSSFFNGLGAEFDNLTALTVASDGDR